MCGGVFFHFGNNHFCGGGSFTGGKYSLPTRLYARAFAKVYVWSGVINR